MNMSGTDDRAQKVEATDRSPILEYLERLRSSLKDDMSGEVATYIPELGLADPKSFGISLATVDGKTYETGDCHLPFTIQSMSKPFTYGHALQTLGRERVLQQVGVEPTGDAFNSIILDDRQNRPFNPMVNAGAIAVAELIEGGDRDARYAAVERLFSRLAGRDLTLDTAVFESERDTGHRNRAIAYMMLNSGMLSRDPEDVLDTYFKQCSVLVTCTDMAMMAATLANHGVCPATGERVYSPDVVRDVLTLMSTCGMYNYAGEWFYEVGIPAKSGVAGGIIAVIPGQLGIAVYSPPLDQHGNSIRGVDVCKALSRDFSLHAFSDRTNVHTVIRREYRGSTVSSKQMRHRRPMDYLAQHGDQIAAIEVQGALYFGSAELLTRRMTALIHDARFVLLDFKRANYSDPAADQLILETIRLMVESGLKVSCTHMRADGPLSRLHRLLRDSFSQSELKIITSTDEALQYYEDELLEGSPISHAPTRYSLGDLDLLQGIRPEHLKQIERITEVLHFEPGEIIVREGDAADLFYVVTRGSASISINLKNGGSKRVSSVGPGFSFGEMALIEGGVRLADVIADEVTVCYAFPVDGIKNLEGSHPNIYAQILANLIRNLSDRLRLANAEIRALE